MQVSCLCRLDDAGRNKVFWEGQLPVLSYEAVQNVAAYAAREKDGLLPYQAHGTVQPEWVEGGHGAAVHEDLP